MKKFSFGNLLFVISLAGTVLFTWLYITATPRKSTSTNWGGTRKAVVKYLYPLGRSCIFNIKAFCVHNPSSTVDVKKLTYCQSYFWLPDGRGGHMKVYPERINCSSNGLPQNGIRIVLTMDNSTYYAECTYTVSTDVICKVKER